jgi:cellulose synthase operon protein C
MMRAVSLMRAMVLAAVWMVSACAPDAPPPSEGASLSSPAVEFAGCATVAGDAHCTMAAGAALDLWIDVDDARGLSLELGTREVDLPAQASVRAGGLALHLEPAALPTTLRLRARTAAAPVFQLTIDRAPEYEWDREVSALLEDGDTVGAIARMQRALNEVAVSERGPVRSRLARAQTRVGDWSAAEAGFIAAIADNRESGRVSAAINDSTVLAFHYLNRSGDLSAAARVLEQAPLPAAGDARSHMQIDSLRGFVARIAGDLGGAEHDYRAALDRALRLGDARQEAVARVGLAQIWAEMGDFARAAETLRHHPAADSTLAPCDQARALNTRAWIHLLAHESGAALGDPMPDLEQASALLQTHCDYLGADRSNVELNRALAWVQRGDSVAARQALQAARALNAEAPAHQRAWMLEIEARIAVAEHNPARALLIYAELDRRAAALVLPDAQWRAALGAAEAQRALGDVDAAIAELVRADALLADYLRDLPALESRALFQARYESLPRQWVDALIERGSVDAAWQVARRYRNAPLRRVQRLARIGTLSSDEQSRWRALITRYQQLRTELDAAAAEDWQLSAQQLERVRGERESSRQQLRTLVEQTAAVGAEPETLPDLPVPAPDELSLLYFPLRQGWVVFAFNQHGLRAQRLQQIDPKAAPDALGRQLLQPVADELSSASRLRLLTYGALRELDFHRLDWQGQALGATHRVVYAADLATLAGVDTRSEHVLLVADPAGDLPAARHEVAGIAATLQRHQPHLDIERLQGRQASTRAIAAALTRATLFHYAGHTAQIGSDAHIGFALAEGQRLELGDILMLERAPRLAVLAACDSARSGLSTPAEALSLAHAFLVRGSLDVVAATRPVGDAESADLTAALYTLRAQGLPIDQALAEAQRDLLKTQPDGDWSAYRVYTR